MAGRKKPTPPADAWEMWGDDARYERNRITGDFRLNTSPWAQELARLDAQSRRESAGLRRAPITKPLEHAMSVSSNAASEASKKGLSGKAKRQYVGGAINRARHEKAHEKADHREAMADARSQIRYHEAQIAGLREGVKQRRAMADAGKPKRAPKAKKPRTLEQQIAAAGGYVPKTPAEKLRKTPVREMTDTQLLRDWENHPPERRRGVLEREMARRQAKEQKAQQPKPAKPAKTATVKKAKGEPSFREQALQRAQLETKPAKAPKHEEIMQAHRKAYEGLAAQFVTEIHGQNRRETYRAATELRKKVYDAKAAAQGRMTAAYDKLEAAKTPQQRAGAQRAIDKAKRDIAEADALWNTVHDLSAAARNSPETTERWLAAQRRRS